MIGTLVNNGQENILVANGKYVYFQPKKINNKYCEVGFIPEIDKVHVYYLNEPCKEPLKDVKIIEEEKVYFDNKTKKYKVRQ